MADMIFLNHVSPSKKGVAVDKVSIGGNVFAYKYAEQEAADTMGVKTLRNEIKVLKQLKDEGFDYLYDSCLGDTPWALVQWADGVNIYAACKAMPVSQRLAILKAAVEPLRYIYRAGWLHGDMQAGHIFISDSKKATLIDFGLAKRMEANGGIRGAGLHYMAPELAASILRKEGGKGVCHSKLETYALAATLFTAYTLRYPVLNKKDLCLDEKYKNIASGKKIKSFDFCEIKSPDIGLEALLLKGLCVDPRKRLDPQAFTESILRL